MIPTPPGWRRRPHGDGAVLLPPDGPGAGAIRYYEVVAGLAPIRTLVAQYLSAAPFAVHAIGDVERLITVEGEHAALVTVRGEVGGRVVQRDLGFVLLDHHHARIAGYALRPEDFAEYSALVRDLTVSDVHLSGVRRRRFDYDPIAGWQARRRGLHAEWYPLDFPRTRAVVHVLPALPAPRVGGAAGLVALLAAEDAGAGWADDGAEPAVSLASTHGPAGWLFARTGRFTDRAPTRRIDAVLEDPDYVYAVRVEALPELSSITDVVYSLATSIRPVPRMNADGSAGAFAHWSE